MKQKHENNHNNNINNNNGKLFYLFDLDIDSE